jgi:L-alanine-DL-glutamate epimerase-like enolase superfamily enzyme
VRPRWATTGIPAPAREHGPCAFELLELRQARQQRLRRVELANRLGVTTSGIARQLGPLERIGLVGRESSPGDARLALVVLTEAGDRVAGEALPSADGTNRALSSGRQSSASSWDCCSAPRGRRIDPVSDAIRSVETGVARLSLPTPLRIGHHEIRSREYACARVTTESGLVGKAMCLTRDAPVAECVERLVAPSMVGVDSSDPSACWGVASRATNMVGRVGLVVRAVGLVDIALWDIAGQRAGVPLWRLLGGLPAAVPVMLVAAYPVPDREPASLADDIVRGAEAGYGLLKLSRDREPGRMRELLDLAHARLPGDARLVVDVSYAWDDPGSAIAETAQWGDAPLAWLEDPVVPENVAAIAAIRRDGRYPIGAGDEVTSADTFAGLLEAAALDVLRLDVVAIGGVTAARDVQALAAFHGVPVSFHVYPELSVHLATVGEAMIELFDRDVPGGNTLDPAHRLIAAGELAVSGGMARPPEAPGLGFDLDWASFGMRGTSRPGE